MYGRVTTLLLLIPTYNMKTSTTDKILGTAKIVTGDIKQTTGKAFGNVRLQNAGKTEKVEGKLQKKIGEIEKVLGN